jgi:hypothetical protein
MNHLVAPGGSTANSLFLFIFILFFWSVWDNDTLSAEAFEAHLLGCWVLASRCR